MTSLGDMALELFKSEICSEDLPVRIACISRMHVIAHALGKERALTAFVPLITECVKGTFCSDDDEMLLCFAKTLPKLIPFLPDTVGPISLIAPLEYLANQDETVIRDAAVESLGTFITPICPQEVYVSLIRMFKADWFSPNLSACALAHYVYPHVSKESREQIRIFYIACANEETPMVKRAAAFHLFQMVAVVEKEYVISELLPIYRAFASDDTQETVRCSCVSSSLALCEVFVSEAEANEHVSATIASLAVDKSWRVRLAIAKVYGKLAKCLGKDTMVSQLLAPLVALMRDQEPDVRKAAVGALEQTAVLLGADRVSESIVPLFPIIGKDPVQQVRAALSGCIGRLAEILGQGFTLAHLVPLLMESIKDDYPTIRFNATASIGTICRVCQSDESTCASLVTLLHTLSQDGSWRTRLAVLEQIPKLCKMFGKEFFETKLESLLLSFFGDSVHAVRAAVTVEIGAVVDLIGEEWTVNHFAAKVLSLYSEGNSYSSRIAILQSLPKIASVMNKSHIETLILPTLQKGCTDTVPNVRFVACEVVIALKDKLEQSHMETLGLDALAGDVDRDVRYFATKATTVVI